MNKLCAKCSVLKPAVAFGKDASRKDGLQPYCRDCRKTYPQNSERKKNWYAANRKSVIARMCERQKLPCVKEYKKAHYQKNKESIKARTNANYPAYWAKPSSKKRAANYARKWRKKNKPIVVWRSLLSGSLRRMNTKKNDRTINMLGYSAKELRKHLESLWTEGMSWDNHGEWHVDHIIPVAAFHQNTPPSVVNALSNLRPLWATTRIVNGVKYEGNLNRSYA
jgi:hypothetical protein